MYMKFALTFLSIIITFISYGQFGKLNHVNEFCYDANDIKVYDLNGDGDLDILTQSRAVTQADGKIVWYENLGGGHFSTEKRISDQVNGIFRVNAADLDEDGDLDVLSASFDDDKLAWYENLGNGIFSSQKIIDANANGARDVKGVDIDNDGDEDIVAAILGDDEIVWYENLGSGTFGAKQVITLLANDPYFVHASDIDNDGDMDLLSASFTDDKIAWYENQGGGVFGSQQVISSTADGATCVYSEDLNNDGLSDVITASFFDDEVSWYQNMGGGVFGSQQIIGYINMVFDIYADDVDLDGDIDVLGPGVVYENQGGGTFLAPNNIAIKKRYVRSGDMNNDGDIDLIYAGFSTSEGVYYYENQGAGIFSLDQAIKPANSRENVTVDIDNDGDIDVVYTTHGEIGWFENLGNGKFNHQVIIVNSISAGFGITSNDINNDGDQDVFYYTTNDYFIGGIENLGNGTFSSPDTLSYKNSFTNGQPSIYFADVDSDGDDDLLSTSFYSNLFWLENQGGVIDTTKRMIASGINPIKAVVGFDVDGDLDNDVMVSSYNTNQLYFFQNLGGGTFGPLQIFSNSAISIQQIKSEDLDLDGDLDIITLGPLSIGWYENIGGILDTNFNFLASISNTFNLSIEDIENDGDQDILYEESNDGVFFIENNGDGTFNSKAKILDFSGDINSIQFADIDYDGLKDLFFSAQVPGEIYWFKNLFQHPYELSGNIYYDANQNGELDVNEPPLSLVTTNLSPTFMASYANVNGRYFYKVDTGAYTVNYVMDTTYWNLTSDSSTYNRKLTSGIPVHDSLDFGFYPDTLFTKIHADITAGFPRCFTIVNYWLKLRNEGTEISDGIIRFELADSLVFVSSDRAPDSVIGRNYYWHYDSLYYNSNDYISLHIQMPSLWSFSQIFKSFIEITALDSLGGIKYSTIDSIRHSIFCGYDPNDKGVLPKGIGSEGYITNNQELEYLIRFQNTGNDTAINVVLRDQLDSNLDWNSLQIESSSDPFYASISNTGELKFTFSNIMLPDSNVDFLGSQGYIKYKINMNPNLPGNTQIFNTCDIYFDFNSPITTNTVLNTIYDCSELDVEKDQLLGCLNDSITNWTPFKPYNNVLWELDSFYTSTNNQFSWIADTSGSFALKLSVNNIFCSLDTTIDVYIQPEIPINNINQSICNGDSIIIGGIYQNSPGLYMDTIQSFYGCDSVLSVNLSIDSAYLINQNLSICQGDSILINGEYQYSSGTFNDTLQSINSCDSIYSTTLTVNLLPSTSILDFDPDTVCLNSSLITLPLGAPSGGVYSGIGVSGVNFDPFLAGVGTHEVIYTYIDNNNCSNSDTSSIIVIGCVGIESYENKIEVYVYPNPTNDIINIEFGNKLNGEYNLVINDVLGRAVFEQRNMKMDKILLSKEDIGKGVFLLNLINKITGERIFVEKLIVQ